MRQRASADHRAARSGRTQPLGRVTLETAEAPGNGRFVVGDALAHSSVGAGKIVVEDKLH